MRSVSAFPCVSSPAAPLVKGVEPDALTSCHRDTASNPSPVDPVLIQELVSTPSSAAPLTDRVEQAPGDSSLYSEPLRGRPSQSHADCSSSIKPAAHLPKSRPPLGKRPRSPELLLDREVVVEDVSASHLRAGTKRRFSDDMDPVGPHLDILDVGLPHGAHQVQTPTSVPAHSDPVGKVWPSDTLRFGKAPFSKGMRSNPIDLDPLPDPAANHTLVGSLVDDFGLNKFSSFDALNQAIVLDRQSDWNEHRCRDEAVLKSALPSPSGRVSAYPVSGSPLPQVILSQSSKLPTHLTLVLQVSDGSANLPTATFVADVPRWLTVRDFLLTHHWHFLQFQQLLSSSAELECAFNGVPGSCFAVVPSETDVVSIEVASGSAPSGITRPPTPPIPVESPPEADRTQPEVTISGTDPLPGSERDSLAIFDVYNHARVVWCPPDASPDALVLLARQHTPQIGAVFGFRWVRFRLPGLPRKQLVIWGDSLPDSRVIPISFAPGPEGICTVEALATYSAIQLVSLACRICQLPDFLVDAVAELETTLWVNEARCFPLDPDAARQADTARLIGHGLAHFLSRLVWLLQSLSAVRY